MCCTGIGDNESLKGNDWVRKSLATLAQKTVFYTIVAIQCIDSTLLIKPFWSFFAHLASFDPFYTVPVQHMSVR